jgi:hypothetical protein
MRDITGKEIKPGDFLIEIYKGKHIFLYISNGSLTKSGRFLRVSIVDFTNGDFLPGRQVPITAVIIVTKEQFIDAFKHRNRKFYSELEVERFGEKFLETLSKM